MATSRAEHLEWCKKRALEYLDQNDVTQAWASMASDLRKNPDTDGHIGIQLGMAQILMGHLKSVESMRHFIEGFN